VVTLFKEIHEINPKNILPEVERPLEADDDDDGSA